MELALYIRPSRLTPNSLFNFPCLPEQKTPPGCEPGRTHVYAKGIPLRQVRSFGRDASRRGKIS